MTKGRLERRFAKLKSIGRPGLITFVTAGDPAEDTCSSILQGLPTAGADIIELGMPFTAPMADGPAIQAASVRALKAGATMHSTLSLVRNFRVTDNSTPVVLMGYFNPIFVYGRDRFIQDAMASGVDGLIIVDLPPEEDVELCLPAKQSGLDFVRLATPTTDDIRLRQILPNASGFLYYVSVTGITGDKSPDINTVQIAVERLRQHTKLPIAVGFGIRNSRQAYAIASFSDAVVVGSAIVDQIKNDLEKMDSSNPELIKNVLDLVKDLASGVQKVTIPS